jgi:uncharacterized membrane protein YjjP (DUF1212 family)
MLRVMDATEATAATGATPPIDELRVRRILSVALRLGSIQLASGSQTTDVETMLRRVTAALGLARVQAIVTFSWISLSCIAPGDLTPTTLFHLGRHRGADFARLAASADLARALIDHERSLDEAEAELERIEAAEAPYPAWLAFVAPGASGAASTVLFGGNLLEGAVTLVIGLLVQPLILRLDRSTIPPFFRLAIAVGVTAILVAAVAESRIPVTAGLVLTGGILRFLPGNALVAGVRDLIDQSIVSGTARLSEAILLGSAVAAGAGIGVAGAAWMGVSLQLATTGFHDWGPLVAGASAFVAVAMYGIRLGVPRFALPGAALIGAVASPIYLLTSPADSILATFWAAIAIGVIGRILADRSNGPSSLWVVPAILVLLPGLAIVQALLAPTNEARVAGLVGSIGIAFAIGIGVAAGDIVVTTIRGLRERVVSPAVDVVHEGVVVFVVRPLEQRLGPHDDAPDPLEVANIESEPSPVGDAEPNDPAP